MLSQVKASIYHFQRVWIDGLSPPANCHPNPDLLKHDGGSRLIVEALFDCKLAESARHCWTWAQFASHCRILDMSDGPRVFGRFLEFISEKRSWYVIFSSCQLIIIFSHRKSWDHDLLGDPVPNHSMTCNNCNVTLEEACFRKKPLGPTNDVLITSMDFNILLIFDSCCLTTIAREMRKRLSWLFFSPFAGEVHPTNLWSNETCIPTDWLCPAQIDVLCGQMPSQSSHTDRWKPKCLKCWGLERWSATSTSLTLVCTTLEPNL